MELWIEILKQVMSTCLCVEHVGDVNSFETSYLASKIFSHPDSLNSVGGMCNVSDCYRWSLVEFPHNVDLV